MKPSDDNIQLGKSVAAAIGFEPHVHPYYDDGNKNLIYVLNCKDPLNDNLKFFCTIGVSDSRNAIEMNGEQLENIPIELLMIADEKHIKVPNIISTCGFYITKNKWQCQPGTIFKNMTNVYYNDTHLKHILFVRPFMWEDKLGPMKLSQKTVNFLVGIPISEKEAIFSEKNGYQVLLDLFIKMNIDYENFERVSAI